MRLVALNAQLAATATGAEIVDQNFEYMRRNAAARYLGVSPRTISDWQRKRLIPFIKPAKKCTIFKRDQLDRAMEKMVVQSVGYEPSKQ